MQKKKVDSWSRVRNGFPGGTVAKNPPANAGDVRDAGSIPGLGRFPGGGNGNPLQYSCLEDSMDRVAWWGYSPWGRKESGVTEHTLPRNIQDEPTLSCHSRKQGSYQRPSKGFWANLFRCLLDKARMVYASKGITKFKHIKYI